MLTKKEIDHSMNNFKKILLTVFIISLTMILTISYAHAQIFNLTIKSNTTSTSNLPTNLSNTSAFKSNNVSTSKLSDICWNSLRHQVKTTIVPFNETKAKGLARINSDFISRIQGYETKFDGSFNTWHLDKTNCAVTWLTTNQVYHLYNSTGGFVKNVIVTEDPISAKILNVTEQNVKVHFFDARSNNWSGYEVAGDGNKPPTSPMEYTHSTFTIPSVSVPSYPPSACQGSQNGQGSCIISSWVGLEENFGARGGSNGILAQTGTIENIACTGVSCNTYNSLFYEFLPDFPVICPAGSPVYMQPGDQITASVYLDILNGGTDASKVDIMTSDLNNANAFCTYSKSYFNSTSPYYSSFITEVPSCCIMPQFNNIDMTSDTVYYNGAYHFITDSYSKGWFYKYNYFYPTMTSMNTGYVNPGPNNDFIETWNPLCSPGSGSWTVPSTCTLSGNVVAPSSVTVPNGVTLRIPYGTTLKMDFTHYPLKINSGGTILLDAGNGTLSPGGAIKCSTC